MKDKIDILYGDCLEVMKNIPDNSIDLVLCDLPYGTTSNKKDVVIPIDKLWKEYLRIGKTTTNYVLFAQGLFYVDLINGNRGMYKYDYAWNKVLKTNFLNAKKMPLRQHEQIAIFYNKQGTYNPQFSQGTPLHSMGKSFVNKDLTNNNYGKFNADNSRVGETKKYPSSLLTYQKPHPSIALHRTEKPIELIDFLVKTYSNEGDIVLDNCCGSGGVGVSCLLNNRLAILIDNDMECINTTKKRINELL